MPNRDNPVLNCVETGLKPGGCGKRRNLACHDVHMHAKVVHNPEFWVQTGISPGLNPGVDTGFGHHPQNWTTECRHIPDTNRFEPGVETVSHTVYNTKMYTNPNIFHNSNGHKSVHNPV